MDGIHNFYAAGYDTAMGNFSQGNITILVSVEDVLWWYPLRGPQVARGDRCSQLVTRDNHPTESVQYKRSHLYKVTSSASVGKTTNTPAWQVKIPRQLKIEEDQRPFLFCLGV